jgi:nucleoid-associated protein YgaU
VVDRKPKLIAAGVVLAVGIGLAMLFRRTEPQAALPTVPQAPPAAALASATPASAITPTPSMALMPMVTPTPLEGQLSPQARVTATSVGLSASAGLPPADAALVAQPASPPTIAPDAVAPPLGTQALPASSTPNFSGGRPVYATAGVADSQFDETAAGSPYQIHVVHPGDSLESLAERYLSDSGRSLELFDLNRDVLDNPHLLRIGAELKIPVEAGRSADE